LVYVFYERQRLDSQVAGHSQPPLKPPVPTQNTIRYKDGEYTGIVADAFFGPMQVKAIIENSRLTGVEFLQYPNDRPTSRQINEAAIPYLKSAAIQSQTAEVEIISGATQSAEAFWVSLASALIQAK